MGGSLAQYLSILLIQLYFQSLSPQVIPVHLINSIIGRIYALKTNKADSLGLSTLLLHHTH